MGMPYSAKAVANYFLEKSNFSIDHLKVQKLVYVSHGWSLAVYDDSMIEDRVEAWIYGPVIVELYHEFKHYGYDQISDFAREYSPRIEGGNGDFVVPRVDKDDNKAKKLLNKVWGEYKKIGGAEMSGLTHIEGTPWTTTRASKADKNPIIDIKTIKDYYVGIAQGEKRGL